MASSRDGAVLQGLSRLFGNGSVVGLTEWQLLERYRSQRDEVAFEALVARHGPMVLGVCRRILGNSSDVDDAFQATFLILVKKAASFRERDAIAHWLYGVAHRVALRARTVAAKRRMGQPITGLEPHAIDDATASRELAWALEDELSRLPSTYRAPIVLCYLQGMTHEEAALRLHWPLGTVKGRLARARALLKARLVRRGIAPSAGAALGLLSRDASAQVSEGLLRETVTIAMRFGGGRLAYRALPSAVATLIPGATMSTALASLKSASAFASILLVAFVGAATAQFISGAGSQSKEFHQREGLIASAAQTNAKGTIDNKTSEEPKPALAVEGPPNRKSAAEQYAELRAQQQSLAIRIFEDEVNKAMSAASVDLAAIVQWSKKALEIENDSTTDRKGPATKHRIRVNRLVDAIFSRADKSQYENQSNYYRLEANNLEWEAGMMSDAASKNFSNYIPPSQRDPLSQAILKALEKPIDVKFVNETPFEEVLKYIKAQTISDEFRQGIPIYLDPIGLQEAEKTTSSPIIIELHGVPLRTTLNLILSQLGLIYDVQGGVLKISNMNGEYAPLTPILHQAELASRGELSIQEMKDLIARYELIFKIREYSEGKAQAPQGPATRDAASQSHQ
ncbi:RNA polymerase sigma factor [Singulisphaera sp. PoT]|uniref:RNA polymerase sigma factor n=1 Tax=Singulisphaera sp. PoT TaxID=3411797 RepID=UPI003BF5322D